MAIRAVSLLTSGKYEFYITAVITTDREGNLLKMRDGNPYKRLKLAVINREGYTQHVYDPLFGEDHEKIEQVVKSIGSETLFRRLKAGRLELKDLIGTGGYCIIGVREGRDGYGDQNSVECYLQKDYGTLCDNADRSVENRSPKPVPAAQPVNKAAAAVPMILSEEEFEDEIPF